MCAASSSATGESWPRPGPWGLQADLAERELDVSAVELVAEARLVDPVGSAVPPAAAAVVVVAPLPVEKLGLVAVLPSASDAPASPASATVGRIVREIGRALLRRL